MKILYIILTFCILYILSCTSPQYMQNPKKISENIINNYSSNNYTDVIEDAPHVLENFLMEIEKAYNNNNKDLMFDKAYEYSIEIANVYLIYADSLNKTQKFEDAITIYFRLINFCNTGFFIKNYPAISNEIKKQVYLKLKEIFNKLNQNTYFINYELVRLERYFSSPLYENDKKILEENFKIIRKTRFIKGYFQM